MVAQHGELYEKCRVEHHVGILLIGIDPLLFGIEHVRPLVDALSGGESTLVIVTHYAAEQTAVGGGYPVVVVEGDAGERRDENPEFGCLIYLIRQARVEGVDAF